MRVADLLAGAVAVASAGTAARVLIPVHEFDASSVGYSWSVTGWVAQQRGWGNDSYTYSA